MCVTYAQKKVQVIDLPHVVSLECLSKASHILGRWAAVETVCDSSGMFIIECVIGGMVCVPEDLLVVVQ